MKYYIVFRYCAIINPPSGLTYSYLEQFFMVIKVFEPMKSRPAHEILVLILYTYGHGQVPSETRDLIFGMTPYLFPYFMYTSS